MPRLNQADDQLNAPSVHLRRCCENNEEVEGLEPPQLTLSQPPLVINGYEWFDDQEW